MSSALLSAAKVAAKVSAPTSASNLLSECVAYLMSSREQVRSPMRRYKLVDNGDARKGHFRPAGARPRGFRLAQRTAGRSHAPDVTSALRCPHDSWLSRESRPLPQAVPGLPRQPMTELTGQHQELAPMMRFVGDEIREHVTDIEGQVAPDIAL